MKKLTAAALASGFTLTGLLATAAPAQAVTLEAYTPDVVTQTDVAGYNNDTILVSGNTNSTVVDSGWVNNKRTLTFTANAGAKFYTDYPVPAGATGYSKFVLTFTDSGNGATVTTTKCDNTMYFSSFPTTTFQVVKYLPYHKAGTYLNGVKLTANKALTATELAKVASLDDDNLLQYREDMALWGASEVKDMVTVTLADVQAAHSVEGAIAKKTGWQAPTKNVTTMAAGQTVVKAWALGTGATATAKWGPNNTVAQKDFDQIPVTAMTGGCTLVTSKVTAAPVAYTYNFVL